MRKEAAILVFVVFASGCAVPPAMPPAVSLTEGVGLTPTDDIDALDVATDARGDVHVVWRERSNVYRDGTMRERVVYRHGSGTPLHWGPRVVVAEGEMGTQHAQVVASDDGVHIFAGERLHHWWLPADGAPRRSLGDMLGDGGPRADEFEAVATRDGFLVVFRSSDQSRNQTIRAVRWTSAGPQTPVLVAQLKDYRGARPQLFRDGDRWVAFWANNALIEYRDPKDGRLAMGLKADVRTASSRDGGASWGKATSAFPSAAEMVEISTGRLAKAPAVFIASDGLLESRLSAGAWTSPLRIAAYEKGFFAGSTETSAVAATQCNGPMAIAWVDARYRRSDRRWWNPLGGFPWGDDPDWDNNDLFVATDLLQSKSAASALVPLRLTADVSMTKDVAIVARGDHLLVFRSGRARVHKAPNDAGAPPEVTQSSVACG